MRLSFSKKSPIITRGRLIVIDGVAGSGKSTQTELLSQALTFAGFKVAIAEFPQVTSKSKALIEEYGKNAQVTPQAKAIFLAADRFEAKKQIEAWLAGGTVVISNTYSTANAGEGGATLESEQERVKFFRWVSNLEHEIFGMPRPDLSIILHMPAETAQLLSPGTIEGKKVNKSEELELLKKRGLSYQELARLNPQTKLVHCSFKGELLSPQEIHNSVWQLVRRIALKNNLQ